jgi:hypothetical protein
MKRGEMEWDGWKKRKGKGRGGWKRRVRVFRFKMFLFIPLF